MKPGSFTMGSAKMDDNWNERPAHQVTISHGFLMSETEVTLAQFQQFWPDFEGTPGFDPYVAGVSWLDAAAFCDWLSRKEGKRYCLPSEAEWEYACRAGTTTDYCCGDNPEMLVQFGNVPDAAAKARFPDWKGISGSDGYVFTAPVGSSLVKAKDSWASGLRPFVGSNSSSASRNS